MGDTGIKGCQRARTRNNRTAKDYRFMYFGQEKPSKFVNRRDGEISHVWRDAAKSGPKIRSVYMTWFHIAYSLCHILGALSYILL
jgi:hypothetical protein